MNLKNKKELGNNGEEIASRYLVKKNYKIIDRNFHCKLGEIDIIAKEKDEIVFIEVKTRTSIEYGRPAEAVDYRKQIHIYKTANYYLLKHNLCNIPVRFDVIEVLLKNGFFEISHIKQIF